MGTLSAVSGAPLDTSPLARASAQARAKDRPGAVVAVSSNKGGVGKTTVATNLAVYLRALREDLPVLLIGLDDQDTIDRMFNLREPEGPAENLKHGWAARSLNRVIRLGQYGIHFVPSPPDTASLKSRAEDSRTLTRILERTGWNGLTILDTKSDLEALTRNAYHAADRIIVPVSDRASLEEAAKTFALLERERLEPERARVLLTLVDRRSRADAGGVGLARVLAAEIERRGWPRYETALTRSPRVDALLSSQERPRSILHHAPGTAVHRQMRALALEVAAELSLESSRPAVKVLRTRPVPRPTSPRASSLDWKALLLRGMRSG